MKIAMIRADIKSMDSGQHTYNGHFLEKHVKYQVLSEQSRVMGFPFILMHPTLKNICLVDIDCLNFL